jgi:16S rRNA G966 N2-methylase RsmD
MHSPCTRTYTRIHANDAGATRNKLISILSLETYRDGGVARLNSLPQYNPLISKLLSSLKTKLVCFLQDHPDTFHIDGDTDTNPHSVKLLDQELFRNMIGEKQVLDYNAAGDDDDAVICAARELQRRTGYELQKRISKLRRRRQRTLLETKVHVTDDVEPGANLDWLCRKVQNELHSYIRLCSDRPVGVSTFSEDWFGIASSLYLRFLKELNEKGSEDNVRFRLSSAEAQDGRLEPALTLVHLIHVHVPPLDGNNSKDHDHALVEKIAARVIIVLRDKSPPIGGMDFGKLLQDYDLRLLTGGKDLGALIERYPEFFQNVEMFTDAKRRGMNTRGDADVKDCCRYIKLVKGLDEAKVDAMRRSSTLVADEVGTYSLTKPRLATAMAKLLFNACKHGHLGRAIKEDDTFKLTAGEGTDEGLALESYTCIDLTAGIGGNTIAFCKTFDQVYAYEIEVSRSKLLEQNLASNLTALDRGKVVVECMDSMEALQKLSLRLRNQCDLDDENKDRVAVFVDPPFGGIHYRSNNENGCQNLNLGKDMPLKLVVSLISVHLSPVTIGLKLPLLFNVSSFVEKVKVEHSQIYHKSLNIRVQIIKKIERQLFVILDIQL